MSGMSTLVGRELKWEQPSSSKQIYELLYFNSSVCTLHLESSFNSRASAVNEEGRWLFDRKGFWQRESFIYDANGEEIARYKANTWRQGGTLVLPNGRTYIVKSNFWSTQFFVTTYDEQPLISITKIGGVFHYSGWVEIHSLAKNLPELPWLVPFAWYLVMLQFRDSAAAAAAT
ncbi:MAG: hypothetical protein CVU42_09760 [Chloroflexi bacterium HGW-Chloroflexi-4]|jgi:hypothetical protein|nr:MAG: hypothetical protein CVU42_09760 [Chloroflexi bacterium HGW-Chloroflexi-4]